MSEQRGKKWYIASAILAGCALAGAAKMYWDGPQDAGAAPTRAGSPPSHHRGVGGTGQTSRPTTKKHYNHDPYVPPTTAPSADGAAGAGAAAGGAAAGGAAAADATAGKDGGDAKAGADAKEGGDAKDVKEGGDGKDAKDGDHSGDAATTQGTGSADGGSTSQPDDAPKSLWERDQLTGDWYGWRTKLEDHGLTIDSSLMLEAGRNFVGGESTAGVAEGYKFDLALTGDAEKLINVKGGTIYLDFKMMEGKQEDDLDGAFQTPLLAYSPRRAQISELWYEQKFMDEKVRVKVGKIDANTEFDNIPDAGEFQNASMSYSPTIMFFPTDPDPSCGAVAFLYPTDHFYAGVGFFDGALANGVETGSQGPATLFGSGATYFIIGEAGVKWTTTKHQDGRLAVGGWGHTGTMERFDGGTQSGSAGPYMLVDQTVWRKHPDTDGDAQGIAVFFQYGYADPAVSPVSNHVGCGMQWTGVFDSRADDIFGLGLTYVDFSQAPGAGYTSTGEWALETFYKVVLTPWFDLKPDLQVIHNPGGVAGRGDAVVGSIQALVTF
jgi:porin